MPDSYMAGDYLLYAEKTICHRKAAGIICGNGFNAYVLPDCRVGADYYFTAARSPIGARLLWMEKADLYVGLFLIFFVSVAFYNYIHVHIQELYERSQQVYQKNITTRLKILVVWGIGITVIFAVLLNQSWFYFIDTDGEEMFYAFVYRVMYVLCAFGNLSTMFVLIKHRKIMGGLYFGLLFSYVALPMFFAIWDMRWGTCFTYLLMAFLAFVLYFYVDLGEERELSEKEAQIIRQEKELTELNTQIMLSQMQPHFLYNILSTISGLCYIDGAEQAKHVVDKFAEYFRENLDSMGKEKYISFEKELHHIETYLWLEQIRFEGALEVIYDIQVADFEVPSLSIQPLVENAVKHGIRGKKGGGTVKISTQELEKEYLLLVEDDGAGFTVGAVQDDGKSHVGIENIQKRLQILCGGSCEIESRIGEGTRVMVHIPR